MNRASVLARNFATDLPAIRAEVSTYPLDDELVIYDAETGESFVLNATGRLVWSLCDGSRSAQAIAEDISMTFDIPSEQALADVVEVLTEFERARLLSN